MGKNNGNPDLLWRKYPFENIVDQLALRSTKYSMLSVSESWVINGNVQ